MTTEQVLRNCEVEYQVRAGTGWAATNCYLKIETDIAVEKLVLERNRLQKECTRLKRVAGVGKLARLQQKIIKLKSSLRSIEKIANKARLQDNDDNDDKELENGT